MYQTTFRIKNEPIAVYKLRRGFCRHKRVAAVCSDGRQITLLSRGYVTPPQGWAELALRISSRMSLVSPCDQLSTLAVSMIQKKWLNSDRTGAGAVI